jgi:hypothetical protein
VQESKNLIPTFPEATMVELNPDTHRICLFIGLENRSIRSICGRTLIEGKVMKHIMGKTVPDLTKAAFHDIREVREEYNPYAFLCPACYQGLVNVGRELERLYGNGSKK